MFALFLTSPTTLPTVHPPSRRLCRPSTHPLDDFADFPDRSLAMAFFVCRLLHLPFDKMWSDDGVTERSSMF